MVKKSWKPVRRGDAYCAPACGRGCTRVEWLKAKRAAARISKQLGPKWVPHVHENLGWFALSYLKNEAGNILLTAHVEKKAWSVGDGRLFADSTKSARAALVDYQQELAAKQRELAEIEDALR